MNKNRRDMVRLAAATPLLTIPTSHATEKPVTEPERLLLSHFVEGELQTMERSGWRGFSDRVMGGMSNAEFEQTEVDGRAAIRLTGNVTRESNGGFIQMAYNFGGRDAKFDASKYSGIELLVLGNNEEYNVHVRTADCGWYDQSYRYTFKAQDSWQRVRVPWSAFLGNGISETLDTSTLQRIAVLGWMREFTADVALAELALYSDDEI